MNPRSEMMVSAGVVFLNNAAVAPMPIKTYNAVMNVRKGQAEKGLAGLHIDNVKRVWKEIRVNFAKLINGDAKGVTYTTSTSSSLVLTADGLHHRFLEGGNIVITDIEYSSNSFVWQLVCDRHGLELRTVNFVNGHFEGWENKIDEKTVLVSVSFVQFKNGYVEDMSYISQLAHENGALLSVDAVQGLGIVEFDNKQVNADFISCGGHKWLLGPLGSGFFYCNPSLLDEFKPITVGSFSDKDFMKMEHHTFEPWDDARRFQVSLNPIIVGMNESLKLIMNWGPAKTLEHSLKLQDHLVEKIENYGQYKLVTNLEPERRSGILRFEHPDANNIFKKMNEKNVIVGYYNHGLRISPHRYNSYDDIDTIVELLKEYG